MRMRPANFPTVRIAQFAVLFFRTNHLFSKMLAAKTRKEMQHMFTTEVSGYWKKHYVFDELSDNRSKKLGQQSIDLIIINTIAPTLFYYGAHHQYESYQDRALDILMAVPGEKNQIIKKFKNLGFETNTAFDTQSLLQLKAAYCDKKKCLSCAIGHQILKSGAHDSEVPI